MKHEPIKRPARGPSTIGSDRTAPARQGEDTLASDFALIGEAIVDAFRGMSSRSRLESRWSELRYRTCCQ